MVMLVLLLMAMMSLPLAIVYIFGFRKKKPAKGLKRLAIAATAKSPWASSRSSQKLNDGKCKWLLLLLCLKKQDR
jgi:hypothetical protein